jgi:urease accessory protein
MFDVGSPFEPPQLQRAEGALNVAFRCRDGTTVLDTLYQAGCLKARFPRRTAGGWAEVIMLNTSGGIAAGDRLSAQFVAARNARLTITAQAAERLYRARCDERPALVDYRISVEPGAAVEWLPQETIFFDDAAVSRRLEVELAADSEFLGVEMLVFGRALMGEAMRRVRLLDRIHITHNGRALLFDAIRIEGDAAALLARRCVAGGMSSVATLVYVAADAAARLPELREALQDAEAGASAEKGLLVARVLAPRGAALRRLVESALFALRDRPLPRVWLC